MSGARRVTVILGAGVAGLAAAWRLSEAGGRGILVLEKGERIGGLAATVAFGEARLDLGSHRIHPGYFPEVLDLLRVLLGDDLLRVPRRGRLRLNRTFMPYPPSLVDLLAALGPAEATRCVLSLLAGRRNNSLRGRREGQDTYEGYLLAAVGRRIYDVFYAPYARKVYGIDPRDLSVKAAKKRGMTGSPWAVARELAAKWLRARPDTGGYFYYPANGFGSIPDALLRESTARGVVVKQGVTVRELRGGAGGIGGIVFEAGGAEATLPVETVISTILLEHLVGLIRPEPPAGVLESARALRWRGIRLLQVMVARHQCLEGETYYFPEERYLFGRISEPKQYSPRLAKGEGETTLNIEVICSPGDSVWRLDEGAFFERIMDDIEATGLFLRHEVLLHRSLRLPAVYPIYDIGFPSHLEKVLGWVESFDNLYSIGRGGMFLHSNVDHSIYLGLRAAGHLACPGARSAGWRKGIADEQFQVRD